MQRDLLETAPPRAPRPNGRPAFAPTEQQRHQVRCLASLRVAQGVGRHFLGQNPQRLPHRRAPSATGRKNPAFRRHDGSPNRDVEPRQKPLRASRKAGGFLMRLPHYIYRGSKIPLNRRKGPAVKMPGAAPLAHTAPRARASPRFMGPRPTGPSAPPDRSSTPRAPRRPGSGQSCRPPASGAPNEVRVISSLVVASFKPRGERLLDAIEAAAAKRS
jgi:hypothetical protein